MKKQTYIIALCVILILSIGCSRQEQNEQYLVYNDIFLELYGTENYHVPFINIYKLDSVTRDSLWGDYIYPRNRPIDERRLLIGMSDELSIPLNKIMLPNYNILTEELDYEGLNRLDSILISRLYKINKNPRKFELKKLTNTGRFELIEFSEIERLNYGDYFRQNLDSIYGQCSISLSRVAFDDTFKFGCLIYSRVDNGGHGHPARFVFIQKTENKWKIRTK